MKEMHRLHNRSIYIGISTLLFWLLFFNRGLTLHDEGYILAVSNFLSQGKILYKDLFVQYPPGIFLLLGSIYKIFGFHILIGRIIVVILGGIISILLYQFTRLSTNGPYAYLPSILFTVWGIPQSNIPWFSWFCLAFFLSQCILMTKNKKNWIVIGIVVGLTVLFKQTFGFVAVVSGMVCMIVVRDKKWIKNILNYTLGISIGLLPGIVYILTTHSWSQFVSDVVLSALPYAKGQLVYTPYPLFAAFQSVSIQSFFKNILYLLPFAIFVLSFISNDSNHFTYKLLVVFACCYFLIGMYPTADMLHFVYVFPITFPFFAKLFEKGYRRGHLQKWLGVIIFFFIVFLGLHRLIFRNYYEFESPYPQQIHAVSIGHDTIYTDSKHANIVKEITQNVQILPTSKKIFVFPYLPLLYIITNTDISGSYLISTTGLLSEEQQKELIRQLQKDKIQLVMMEYPSAGYVEQNLIYQYLMTHFVFYKQIENIQLRIAP